MQRKLPVSGTRVEKVNFSIRLYTDISKSYVSNVDECRKENASYLIQNFVFVDKQHLYVIILCRL